MLMRWMLCCLIFWIPVTAMAGKAWVMVDTDRGTVSVHQDKSIVLQLHNASHGRGGVFPLHLDGDGSTPLGRFHVIGVNYKSRYGLFFALDYPTAAHASLAYLEGVIDLADFYRIKDSFSLGEYPPQNTPLGGNIGIHGLGAGSKWVHRRFNWTNGCVALTNLQIEKLAPWLEIGTLVVIQ